MVQRHRGILKVWNMALLILAFHLALLGTFLDRSGVLGSVHAFAQTAQAPVMLGFISGSLVASLVLLFARLHVLRGEEQLESLVSREGGFILNNYLIVAVTFVVFWGTMYPLVAEALRGDRVTVAAPFFNRVNGPLLLAVFVLMGLGPLVAWRRASARSLARNLAAPLAAAALVVLLLPALGIRSVYPVVGFAVSAFAAASVFQEWGMGTLWRHRNRGEGYPRAFVALFASNRARHGGYVVHLAAALVAVAVIGSSFFRTSVQASLSPGESLRINQYRLQYQGLEQSRREGKDVTAALFSLYNDEHPKGSVVAAREFHPTVSQPVTEIGLRSTPAEDLYVVLGDWDMSTQRAVFHVEVIPMVMWIWIGGGIFVLGSLIAFWPAGRRPQGEA
jgi:cytochrome c-type biogenesis protein CcmF